MTSQHSKSPDTKMHCNLNIAGYIVIALFLCGLIYFLKTKYFENFIVFLDEKIIPTDCYNYIVTDGIKYYLLDTRKVFDGTTNPRAFESSDDAIKYLKTQKCETNIPFVNLLVKKRNPDDPTVSYQRECNRQIAPHLFDLDVCNIYGKDNDVSSAHLFSKINKIERDKAQYSNYDAETCMINKAVARDPELDDAHFKQYFADYFNRMNSQIDDKYLYITSN
jgi:hypothetical protein